MTKGEDGVYTGVLALPKGTRFELKILKSTVDGTSGGNNVVPIMFDAMSLVSM